LGLCRGLTHLFTDIDDTLTRDGMLPRGSYGALWQLAEAGIGVIAVTGRPAGWCDHIARMWPVSGVVGENGALCYVYDRTQRRMRRRTADGLAGIPGRQERMQAAAARVLRDVPGTALAADQAFRTSDIAIDYREDVAALGPDAVDAICRILAEEGMRFRVSSIHVNFWLGDFDKTAGVRMVVELTGENDRTLLDERAVFIGDSPNDEPLFQAFAHSVAVANIREFLPGLEHLPEFVTEAEFAEGFCEAASAILDRRGLTSAAGPGCTPASR
jgi:hypothetical protein